MAAGSKASGNTTGTVRKLVKVACAACGTLALLGGVYFAATTLTRGSDTSGNAVGAENSIAIPRWQEGATFDYSLLRWKTDAAGVRQQTSQRTRVVNVGMKPATQQYTLAAAELDVALEHAVLNGFPFLGRVSLSDLGVYEDGAPQALFGFWPITVASNMSEHVAPWHFRLFQTNWQGAVVGIEAKSSLDGKSDVIKFRASERVDIRGAASKRSLTYELDVGAGFIGNLVLTDAAGESQLEMKLDTFQASGFKGNAYFVRATDVFDGKWELPKASDAANTFQTKAFESGFSSGKHRTDGAWDVLIYFAEHTMACDLSSVVTLKLTGKDTQTSALVRSIDAKTVPTQCTEQVRQTTGTTVGSISGPLEEAYNIDVSLEGSMATLKLQVAGGLVFNYTV